jgi:hypothetical protein
MDNLRTARRGVDIEDDKWFSKEAILKLHSAYEEVYYLLNRGYKIGPIIELIGGHYQFSVRQRNSLQRAVASEVQVLGRKKKELEFCEARQQLLAIDGFNLIITLEVALSEGVLIAGNDGALRDLAGLRGTYSVIDKTILAIELIGRLLNKFEPAGVKFYLDVPVSNSGRLKGKILEQASDWSFPAEVELVPNADPILVKMKNVVTSDSVILDECDSWLNVSKEIVNEYIPNAKIINFIKSN